MSRRDRPERRDPAVQAGPVYLIPGFHLDALSSGLALNVELDTTRTVAATNTYRLFARTFSRYGGTQPERIHRDFIDTDGTIHIDHDTITVALKPRTYSPLLFDAGYHTSKPHPLVEQPDAALHLPPMLNQPHPSRTSTHLPDRKSGLGVGHSRIRATTNVKLKQR
jgi:hypothetical protein